MTDRTYRLVVLALIAATAILTPMTDTASAADTSLAPHMLMGQASSPIACAEDAPCWNWVTMGNHKRGVVTLHGNMRVVGPCKFQYLMRTGHIAYTVKVGKTTYRTLDRLKGDRLALTGDCD